MVNPQFVNLATKNFHLQPASPLIDKGTTLSQVANDYDGVARPQGSAYDIGAFEYFASLTPPSITGFTPASGPVGTSVTINGTNFAGATLVTFGGVSADFTVNSATTIQATVPGGGDERADQRDDTGRHGHQYQQLHCEQSAHDHQFHAGDGTCRRQCQHHRYRL